MTGGTPLHIIAHTTRIVTKVVDRLTGDRASHPLLVCHGVKVALGALQIKSDILYGKTAWVEILEDEKPIWAESGVENPGFWVETQFGEVVDLNASVAHRLKSLDRKASKYSPPMLWSKDIPHFYRFEAEGIAEIDPQEPRQKDLLQRTQSEIETKIAALANETETDFANEPLICTGQRLLDDTMGTFQHFNRALAVFGLPRYHAH